MIFPENNSKNACSAVILAGGNSARMGFPKPWLKISSGTTFLSEIIFSFKKAGIKDVVVVINERFTTSKWEEELIRITKNVTIVKNNQPDKGRLFSLQLGLKEVQSSTILIHNVDNPFVEQEVLEQLITSIKSDITIPSYKGKGGHPVLINHTVKDEITNNYENYETLKTVFDVFKKEYIDVSTDSILTNINTPQEFEAATRELA